MQREVALVTILIPLPEGLKSLVAPIRAVIEESERQVALLAALLSPSARIATFLDGEIHPTPSRHAALDHLWPKQRARGSPLSIRGYSRQKSPDLHDHLHACTG